ncbi:MAG TPA: hypothetical protein VL866_24280 [Pyrinomonadaceae bacterium]|nr:hypothetical protein [Pyrinomonadaceae bacterium]
MNETAHGKLDKVNTRLCRERLSVSSYLQALYPNFSFCGRCEFPWPVVRSHDTSYRSGSSCFPLCEDCWQELGTPANRLPYYMALMDLWESEAHRLDLESELAELPQRRELVRRAVLEEGREPGEARN